MLVKHRVIRVGEIAAPVDDEEYLPLGAPTNLALLRDKLTYLERWVRFACPGGDPNAAFTFTFQTNTEYVVGECFAGAGNATGYLFQVTVAGTSGGSEPTWGTGTVRSLGSNSGGTTTSSGTMTAACVLNPSGGWTGTHRSNRISLDNAYSLWYYDILATIWGIRDYMSRTEILTAAYEKFLEHCAACALSNFLQRNPFGSAPAGYHHFSTGVTQDYLRQSRTYKYASTVTLANLLAQATTYALYGPDLGPQYYNGSYGWDEALSREMEYYLMNCVEYARANDGTLLPDITYGGVTAPRERWLIPYALNHMRMWMDYETPDTPGGWAPFMFALTANSLREWYDHEVSRSRDPDRYCITGQIGSLTNTAAIDFPWTTIPEALEEFCYFLRNEAVSSVETGELPMWDSAAKAYIYRTNEGVDEPAAVDLNGLIWPTFAWVSNWCRENGSVTAMTPLQMMEHADEMLNQAEESPFDSPPGAFIMEDDTSSSCFTGKIYSETYKLPMLSGFAARNAATGRND